MGKVAGMDLEQFRRSRGLSYEALAGMVGDIDGSTLGRICRGERWPRPERLRQICAATGGVVTVDAMLENYLAQATTRPARAAA